MSAPILNASCVFDSLRTTILHGCHQWSTYLLSSPLLWVRVTRSLVLCVMFCRSSFVHLCCFSFGHCVVCPYSIPPFGVFKIFLQPTTEKLAIFPNIHSGILMSMSLYFFFRTIRFYGFIFFFAEYCWIRCCEQIQYCIINFTLFHNIDCYQLSMYVVKPISTYLYANLMTKMLLFQLTKYQVMYRVYASRIRLPISLKVFVVTIHLMT